MKSREYYTEFAEKLPKDTVILTAGCAKYRYNKLKLGDIGGIPRVLDAGQCNDSYSLAVIALKLKEVFGLDDINKLPIAYNIAWYEQKAVIVLLALLYLGVKNIHLGPTLPGFLSPNVAKVLVEKFGIAGVGAVDDDIKLFMHRNREPLLHCAVYIELIAHEYDALKLLQTDVLTELVRSKLNVDRLLLRQQQGFLCVGPSGRNVFGAQFERVLPASSVANLYPFNYSGKTDAHGFYIGRDKFGSNILVDLDKRDDDKTNPCCLILGNSGQGKSYLLKLLLCNILESGKNVLCLDPEHGDEQAAGG